MCIQNVHLEISNANISKTMHFRENIKYKSFTISRWRRGRGEGYNYSLFIFYLLNNLFQSYLKENFLFRNRNLYLGLS